MRLNGRKTRSISSIYLCLTVAMLITAKTRGVTQPSGVPRHFLRSGPLKLITKNSRTVGGPLPPVGPPSLDATDTPSLRHWQKLQLVYSLVNV